jgi:predicted Co/Zn/Cd cation transporter (cation efflux family)
MRGRVITATLLVAVGLVWIGQGLGLLSGSSFMVGDGRWAAAGLVAVVIGAAIAISARRSRRQG